MLFQGLARASGTALLVWLSASFLDAVPLAAQPPGEAATGPSSQPALLNLFEKYKSEYEAGDAPKLVDVGPAIYLAVEGKGAPGGVVFSRTVGALYGVAYSLKMKYQFSGKPYEVGPLEGLWWGNHDKHSFVHEAKDTWNWKLLIRTPTFVTEEDLKAAVGQMGGHPDAGKVLLETIEEGRCVQMLHVGPYESEDRSIAEMHSFAQKQGLKLAGFHHEIYLSDPNRTPPEKLRTILRQPVK